jgi:hypothetical protein
MHDHLEKRINQFSVASASLAQPNQTTSQIKKAFVPVEANNAEKHYYRIAIREAVCDQKKNEIPLQDAQAPDV